MRGIPTYPVSPVRATAAIANMRVALVQFGLPGLAARLEASGPEAWQSLYTSDTLEEIARAVAGVNPDLAISMRRCAEGGINARQDRMFSHHWYHAARLLASGLTMVNLQDHHAGPVVVVTGSAPAAPPPTAPAIAPQLLARVTHILEVHDSERRDWIKQGLEEIGVPDPEGVIKKYFNPRFAGTPITLQFVKSSDNKYRLYKNRSPNGYQIAVPPNARLDERTIRMIVARFFVVETIFGTRNTDTLGRYAATAHTGQRLPFLMIDEAGVRVFTDGVETSTGRSQNVFPFRIADSSKKEWHLAHKWLTEGTESLQLASRGEGSERAWKSYLKSSTALQIFIEMLRPFIFRRLRIIIEFKSSDLGFRIDARLTSDLPSINIEMDTVRLETVDAFDLVDLIMLALIKRHGAVSRPRVLPEDLRIDHMREGKYFTDRQIALTRSFLHLLLSDRIGKSQSKEALGRHENARPILQRALSAIKAYVDIEEDEKIADAWMPVTSVLRWKFRESGIPNRQPIVDVLPADTGVMLVHIIGEERDIKAKDWLFILAAIAKNPGRAVRVNAVTHEVLLGFGGEVAALYNPIASQTAFRAFDVHDPRVQFVRSGILFPTGTSPLENPNYRNADPETKRLYREALAYFHGLRLPEKLKPYVPISTDTFEKVKSKMKGFAALTHPDKTDRVKDVDDIYGEIMMRFEDIERIYHAK